MKCILPFAPLFQQERLKDFKIAVIDPILGGAVAKANSDQEAQKEQTVWEVLTQQGITTAHLERHPLDDALAFKDYLSTQTRSSRVIPLEVQLSVPPTTSQALMLTSFVFPAFRMKGETIPEDV
jgi:hypothetical protein